MTTDHRRSPSADESPAPGWIAAGLGGAAALLGVMCYSATTTNQPPIGGFLVPAFLIGSVLGITGLVVGGAAAKTEAGRVGGILGVVLSLIGAASGIGTIIATLVLFAHAQG